MAICPIKQHKDRINTSIDISQAYSLLLTFIQLKLKNKKPWKLLFLHKSSECALEKLYDMETYDFPYIEESVKLCRVRLSTGFKNFIIKNTNDGYYKIDLDNIDDSKFDDLIKYGFISNKYISKTKPLVYGLEHTFVELVNDGDCKIKIFTRN